MQKTQRDQVSLTPLRLIYLKSMYHFSTTKGIISKVTTLINFNMSKQSEKTSDRLGDNICHMYNTESASIQIYKALLQKRKEKNPKPMEIWKNNRISDLQENKFNWPMNIKQLILTNYKEKLIDYIFFKMFTY